MTLEERIARLEQLVIVNERPSAAVIARPPTTPSRRLAIYLTLIAASAGLAYYGLGLPNHPYQVGLGVLAIALAYHRRWLKPPAHVAEWLLAAANCFVVAMLFKLIIGSGIRHPLWWLKYPELSMERASDKWFEVVPNLKMLWQATPLTAWEVDLTLMQTFLLIVTLIGALFRFQPFVSLTAFLLIAVSLPAFADFNWTWVFPAMTMSAIALYVQMPNQRR